MPPVIATPETEGSHIKVLIYGNPGIGKTVFAATAQDHPALADVLFLNIEGGLISVAGRRDIAYETIQSVQQLEEIFWCLAGNDPQYEPYRTIVIDSATELQSLQLDHLVRDAAKKDTKRDIDAVQLQDYGKSTKSLRRIFRNFRDLDRHVIWTGLPKTKYKNKKDEETGEPAEVRPSVTDKLGTSLMGFVDYVWYYFMDKDDEGNDVRRILTSDFGAYKAKTRGMQFSQALGQVYDNPTMPDLYNLYLESEGAIYD